MKKFIIFLSTVCLCMTCFGQTKAIVKIADRISIKTAKRSALEIIKTKPEKELLKEGLARTGKKYTGEALGQQIVKRAMRESVMEKMKKQGIESFLAFGKNNAKTIFEHTGFSQVRKKMLEQEVETKTKKSFYHKTIDNISNKTKEVNKYINRTATRIIISSKNQFITEKQYLKWINRNPNAIIKTGVKDADILRTNMYAVMGKNSKYAKNFLKNGNQAHHIIGNRTPKAAEILKKYDIDINDPMNGIFLPSSNRSGLRGTIHRGGHTQEYYDYVEQLFMNCKSQKDCYEVLDKIKKELYEGKIKLYSPQKHASNRTF